MSAERQFKGMLARVFSDAVLEDAERAELAEAVKNGGLSGEQLQQTIASFTATTFQHAMADGTLSDRERDRLRAIVGAVRDLGLPDDCIPGDVRAAVA
jgi:tellurite resistance protein